ncbi:hypothetical protein J2T14_001299 [Paenibacillus harenae]|nr:hypothetical protein [Paenibacillus harenae]
MVNVQIVDKPSMYLLGVEGRIGNEQGEMSIASVWEHHFQSYQQLFSNVPNRGRPEDDAEYALSLLTRTGSSFISWALRWRN